MNRLIEIGFQQAGHWQLVDGRIAFVLSRLSTQRNVLYAFICDGAVKYIGKSRSTLAARMQGYRSPAPSQTTNVRNNRRVTEVLTSGGAVDIFVLPDNGLLHYGQFHLNLAAGLEDDLIRVIAPEWNGGEKEPPQHTADPVVALDEAHRGINGSFTFVLHSTYFRTGFFNVGVASQALLGSDAKTIELFMETSSVPLLGTINRTANANGTPRIMGGKGLRDWFLSAANEMDVIHVDVLSPTAIRLHRRPEDQ